MDDFDEKFKAAMEGPAMPDLDSMELSLDGIAVTQHEACSAFQRAGFARDEALYLTAAMMSSNPGRPPLSLG